MTQEQTAQVPQKPILRVPITQGFDLWVHDRYSLISKRNVGFVVITYKDNRFTTVYHLTYEAVIQELSKFFELPCLLIADSLRKCRAMLSDDGRVVVVEHENSQLPEHHRFVAQIYVDGQARPPIHARDQRTLEIMVNATIYSEGYNVG